MLQKILIPIVCLLTISSCSSKEEDSPDSESELLTAAEVANVLCVGMSACSTDVKGDLQDCLQSFVNDHWYLNSRPYFKKHATEQALCAQKTDTCEGFRECMGECTQASRCDGNTHISCKSGFNNWARNCEEEGLVCDPERGCILPDANCEEPAYCKGNISLICPSENQETPMAKDCSKENKVCNHLCVDDTQETCERVPGFDFGFWCDEEDPTLIRTCIGDKPATFSCTSLDKKFRCLPDPDQAFDCTDASPARDCELNEKMCDGNVAVLCRRGKKFRIDCGALNAKCTLGPLNAENSKEVIRCVL